MPVNTRILRRRSLLLYRQKPQHPPQPQQSLDRVLHLLRVWRLFGRKGVTFPSLLKVVRYCSPPYYARTRARGVVRVRGRAYLKLGRDDCVVIIQPQIQRVAHCPFHTGVAAFIRACGPQYWLCTS